MHSSVPNQPMPKADEMISTVLLPPGKGTVQWWRPAEKLVSNREVSATGTKALSMNTHPGAAHDEKECDVEVSEPDGLHGILHSECLRL